MDPRVTELPRRRALHPATELGSERLHAIADAEDRYPQLEHRVGNARRLLQSDRFRSAGEDDAARREVANELDGRVERMDFAVDTGLADAASDQLGVLGTEVDDQQALDVQIVGHLVSCPAS